MQTVFANKKVAQVWAQQTQGHGKSGNGNFWFSGNTIYSYAQPIGKIVHDVNGDTVALITNRRWSITTSSHQSNALGAVYSKASHAFRVPTLDDHGKNLASLIEAYTTTLATAKRKRSISDFHKDWTIEKLSLAIAYAKSFGLNVPEDTSAQDWQAVVNCHASRKSKKAA